MVMWVKVFEVSMDHRQGVSDHFKIILTYFSVKTKSRGFFSFAKQGFLGSEFMHMKEVSTFNSYR